MQDDPQLFLWGGDNIYVDMGPYKGNINQKYKIQNSNKDYINLKKQMPIIGIWDDHDYGINDGNTDYLKKYLSQQLFQDFMMIPLSSPTRAQEGIYTSYTFGSGKEKVKFILLDNRFHLTKKNAKNPTVLGAAQWIWLEKELKNSQAMINFIVSGIPVLPNQMIQTEEWADYPKEKKKLLALISKYKPKGVFFLSGDKHFSAITHNHGFAEFMSSGLTHTTSAAIIPWLRTIFPISFFKLNYGLVSIDWNNQPIKLTIEIKSQNGLELKEQYNLVNSIFTHLPNSSK